MKKEKIKSAYVKKKKILQKYIQSAPFTRLTDKITFIVGVMMVIWQAFILGRFPDKFYYDYHTIVLSVLVFSKFVYYKHMGWHYYFTDFCYAANFLLLVFLNFFPKNDYLFKACYFYANGCLAIAVAAFRNQMVFHKFDNLSSLALHIFPQTCLWNLRWHTMPYEATLPPEKRRFLDIDTTFEWKKFFMVPMAYYSVWIVMYYLINFKLAKKRIRERNYDNMFRYYKVQKWSYNMIYVLGAYWAPAVFLGIHFTFFMGCHIASFPTLYSFELHTFLICFWLTCSVWNASCFYMDYFSKKYELSLQRLEQVEQQLNEDKKD